MEVNELRKTDLRAEAECPDCLKFQVHTPVEKWKRTEMKYCTFHYWMMKGREKHLWMGQEKEGYRLDEYVERSRHFGFITSLPSPEDIAAMMKQSEVPVIGPAKPSQELTLSIIAS